MNKSLWKETTPRNIHSTAHRSAKELITTHFPELSSHKELIFAIGARMEGYWYDGTSYGEEHAECSNCSQW